MSRYDMEMRRSMRDSRNPYGSRGGYVVDGRQMRRMRMMRDRGMYDYNYEHEMEDGRRRRNAKGQYMADRAYEHEMPMYGDYTNMPRKSMDYGSFHEERGYKPVEAMGYFTGYYGGGRDMRYDSNYPMYDYGDYGESLTKEELEHWCKKMMSELDEREKQMLSKEQILQRAKNIGIEFKDFNEMEYYVNVVKNYTDHKKSIGENPEMAMKLARDDFFDEDGEYKGSEWLAIYYDTFVDVD